MQLSHYRYHFILFPTHINGRKNCSCRLLSCILFSTLLRSSLLSALLSPLYSGSWPIPVVGDVKAPEERYRVELYGSPIELIMAAQYNTNDTSESRPPFNATGVDNSQRAADSLLNLANGTGHIPIISEDDALLESLGYRPELKREFSYLTVFGQSFGAMGIAPAIAESMIFSLGSAGSPGMVWTYLVGCLSLMPVAFSLGELGSSMPTAGGLYYVSTHWPMVERGGVEWKADDTVGCDVNAGEMEGLYVLASVSAASSTFT